LHLSELEPAEPLFESVEKLPRIEKLLDVGFTQRHDLPDAFPDFEGGPVGLIFNRAHWRNARVLTFSKTKVCVTYVFAARDSAIVVIVRGNARGVLLASTETHA
jgi:hypothetical protein